MKRRETKCERAYATPTSQQIRQRIYTVSVPFTETNMKEEMCIYSPCSISAHWGIEVPQNKITYQKEREESFTSYQHGVDNMHYNTNASELNGRDR